MPLSCLESLRQVVCQVAAVLHGFSRLVRVVLIFEDGTKIPLPVLMPWAPPCSSPADIIAEHAVAEVKAVAAAVDNGAAFEPNPAQCRVLEALTAGPKTSTQLRRAEPHFYDKPRGVQELVAHGMVERICVAGINRWKLTSFGEDWTAENGLGKSVDESAE